MTKSSAAKQAIFREPHPLARELLERIDRGSSVLEIGPGSGRNFAAFIAKADVRAIESDERRAASLRRYFGAEAYRIVSGSYAHMAFMDHSFKAVIATHALLHGMPDQIQQIVEEIARVSRPGAPLFATFGSPRDARFGNGTRLGPQSFAPASGDEAGVTHSYFTESELRSLLATFAMERLEEVSADNVAGSWAHAQEPLHNAVHWFVVARKV
ncbi:MAG: class I SAM-dependent methyltransferase [Candidatus Eremiobacteraeota bacterium]|nr:class I SAM-dependent methyltransferase [Candidatus Eremiobacteraeota bacterium]